MDGAERTAHNHPHSTAQPAERSPGITRREHTTEGSEQQRELQARLARIDAVLAQWDEWDRQVLRMPGEQPEMPAVRRPSLSREGLLELRELIL
jgi:hypothetical protein